MEQVEIKHEGKSYKLGILPFGALKGLKIKTQIAKKLAPAILNYEGEGLVEVLKNVDFDDIENLVLEILASSTLNDEELSREVVDKVFTQNYILMYKVIGKIIEVNGFLGKGGLSLLNEPENPITQKTQKEKS